MNEIDDTDLDWLEAAAHDVKKNGIIGCASGNERAARASTVFALIARLRAAEARADDAERRGWIMGRDAAIAALGCPVCSGDCGAANPQVAHCPVRALTPPQEPSTNG